MQATGRTVVLIRGVLGCFDQERVTQLQTFEAGNALWQRASHMRICVQCFVMKGESRAALEVILSDLSACNAWSKTQGQKAEN